MIRFGIAILGAPTFKVDIAFCQHVAFSRALEALNALHVDARRMEQQKRRYLLLISKISPFPGKSAASAQFVGKSITRIRNSNRHHRESDDSHSLDLVPRGRLP